MNKNTHHKAHADWIDAGGDHFCSWPDWRAADFIIRQGGELTAVREAILDKITAPKGDK